MKTLNKIAKSGKTLVQAGSIVALGFILSAPAQAETGNLDIEFSRTQLQSSAKATVLYEKIENKIENFCTSHGVKGLRQRMAERQCIAEMLESAVQQINSPQLSAIHDSKVYVASSVAP